MRVAQAFDELMESEGRKNSWLAPLLGVSKATVGRLRNGEIEISIARLQEIERHLGIEPGDLLRAAGYFEPTLKQGLRSIISAAERRKAMDEAKATVQARRRESPVAAKKSGAATASRGRVVVRPKPPAR